MKTPASRKCFFTINSLANQKNNVYSMGHMPGQEQGLQPTPWDAIDQAFASQSRSDRVTNFAAHVTALVLDVVREHTPLQEALSNFKHTSALAKERTVQDGGDQMTHELRLGIWKEDDGERTFYFTYETRVGNHAVSLTMQDANRPGIQVRRRLEGSERLRQIWTDNDVPLPPVSQGGISTELSTFHKGEETVSGIVVFFDRYGNISGHPMAMMIPSEVFSPGWKEPSGDDFTLPTPDQVQEYFGRSNLELKALGYRRGSRLNGSETLRALLANIDAETPRPINECLRFIPAQSDE